MVSKGRVPLCMLTNETKLLPFLVPLTFRTRFERSASRSICTLPSRAGGAGGAGAEAAATGAASSAATSAAAASSAGAAAAAAAAAASTSAGAAASSAAAGSSGAPSSAGGAFVTGTSSTEGTAASRVAGSSSGAAAGATAAAAAPSATGTAASGSIFELKNRGRMSLLVNSLPVKNRGRTERRACRADGEPKKRSAGGEFGGGREGEGLVQQRIERESANGRFSAFFSFFLSSSFLSNRVDLKRAPHLCTSWTVYNARALRTAMRLCCEKRVNLEFGSGPLVFSKKSPSAGLSLSQIFVCLLFVSFLVLARVSTMYSFPNLVEGEEERE